mmetsp:Transcript_3967/g.8541  ORF Transcript_3967/g.8541 Transcript_3967/m.8541 type:complete len:280 (+) Transcript_3967:86-925(+)
MNLYPNHPTIKFNSNFQYSIVMAQLLHFHQKLNGPRPTGNLDRRAVRPFHFRVGILPPVLHQGLAPYRQVVAGHAVQRGVPVGILRVYIGAGIDQCPRRVLAVLGHAANVQWPGTTGRDLFSQVGMVRKNGNDRFWPRVDGPGHEGVSATICVVVDGTRQVVVVLVLRPDHYGPVNVSLDTAAVDPRSHRIGVRIETVGIRRALQAVLFGHSLGVRIESHSDSVLAIVVHAVAVVVRIVNSIVIVIVIVAVATGVGRDRRKVNTTQSYRTSSGTTVIIR